MRASGRGNTTNPCFIQPCLFTVPFPKCYRNIQKPADMSQAWGPEVTTLKKNFCFYIRKTGRQTQGLKKPGMRSSQKMSSRCVPVSEQHLVWCEHTTTVTAVPARGLLENSDFIRKTELWEYLPREMFLPCFNFAPVLLCLLPKSVCWYFSQYFPFSEVSVSLHILKTSTMAPLGRLA